MLDYLLTRLLVKYPILGWLAALAGLLLLPIGGVMEYNFQQLLHSPATTMGTVETVPGSTRKGGKITYRYMVNGHEYQNTVSESAVALNSLTEGGSIVVHYDAGNPAASLSEGASPGSAIGVICVGIILLFFPLFGRLARWRDMRRRERRARRQRI